MVDQDNISIIIRNKNEARWIGHAIQSCLDIWNCPEIIIVDNASSDESMDIVNEFCWSDIKVCQCIDSPYTPGKSINLGVTQASRENILILSAHCQLIGVDFSLVTNLLKDYIAVFGKQIPIYRGRKINKRYIWSHFTDEKQVNMWSEIENRHFLHNAFCFYKKEMLEKYKFNERLPSKEDRYWAKDIINKSLSFYYEPTAVCHHYWTPNGATWKGIG